MTTATFDSFIKYKTIDGGSRGLLGEDLVFDTPILGYSIELRRADGTRAALRPDGKLYAYAPFIWDFGTYAIDTPAMVVASVAHDIICWLTNAKALPWKYRAVGDKLLRDLLKACAPGKGVWGKTVSFASRWWRWTFVSINSTITGWRMA